MATKTTGGRLLLVAAAVIVVVAVPEVRNTVTDVFGNMSRGTELVGEGETQFMVAASAASEVDKCTPQQG